MPTHRIVPLLAAGAICLTLAACGSDDDPPPQANAPAQTQSADPAETSSTPAPPTTAPSDATSADGGADGASGSTTSKPSDDGKAAASGSETEAIRGSLVALQEAFAAKDGQKACSLMIGVPKKGTNGLSCESLSQGPKEPLAEENRKIAATAKVTVDGNEATADLGAGVKFTLRKIDGRWRVDYSQMVGGAGGSR